MPFQQNNTESGVEIPFKQERDRELGYEMYLVNYILFDITDLKNGTYFIDYAKDLYSIQNSYKKEPTGDGLLIISIPTETLKKCKISNEFISKENFLENEN